MTVTVDMGNGQIVEFPDEETANRFFAEQLPPQGPAPQAQAAPSVEAAPPPVEFNPLGTPQRRFLGEAIAREGEARDVVGQGARGIVSGGAGLLDFFTAPGRSFVNRIRGEGPVGLEALQGPASGAVSEFTGVEPQTTAGEFTRTAGEFLPGAAAFGGLSPSNLLRFGIVPGLASEAAGQATEGTAAEPFARAGAALAAPLTLQGLENVIRRTVSPGGGAEPSKLAAAALLEREGVRVTAGQATGNESQLFREAATRAGQNLVDDQAQQFTRAVLKRIGIDANRASPEVMQRAAREIGSVFDDVAKGIDVPPNADMLTKMARVLEEYRQIAPRAGQAPIVRDINAKMVRAFRSDTPLTSAQVLNWRSALSKLTRTGDAATREAAVSSLEVLDDALAQTLTAAGRADDVTRLATARSQWRNLIAIESAVTRAGEQAATGIITPANLRNALAAQGRRAFAQGQGDLNDLARAGVTLLKPLPQSGTQPRTLAREITAGAQGGTAAGLGSFAMGAEPTTAAAIGAATVALPRARNAFLASPAGQALMRNQALSPGRSLLDQRLQGTIAGLLASQ